MRTPRAIVAILLMGCFSAVADISEEEAWLEADHFAASEVNEGELEFLAEPPAELVHYQVNHVTIDTQSLEEGWVGIEQCHRNLDPVPLAQVLFSPDGMRNLRVTAAHGIRRAWVEGNSVQLEEVERGAHLCLEVDARSLDVRDDGSITLQNGPYQRRFLDGFYPLHVTTIVHLEVPDLQLAAAEPPPQPGLGIRRLEDVVYLDAWFAGVLITQLHFRTAS